MLRSKVAYLMREFMAKEGFIEIETPVLTKSTPEGAGIIWCPAVCIRAVFTHCPSHRSCSSSF